MKQKWTKEKCREAALKCKTRSEFRDKYPGAYDACLRNNWLDEVCSHMEQRVRRPYIWTKENCKQAALKCKTRTEFHDKYPGAYRACLKNNWLDELCSHMEQKVFMPKGYWTKEKCKQAALECKSRGEFQDKYPGAYSVCYKNGWWDELCSHMDHQKIKPKGYWTKEKCKQAALECKTRSEFKKKHPSAVNACYKNGWLPEMCSHMNK